MPSRLENDAVTENKKKTTVKRRANQSVTKSKKASSVEKSEVKPTNGCKSDEKNSQSTTEKKKRVYKRKSVSNDSQQVVDKPSSSLKKNTLKKTNFRVRNLEVFIPWEEQAEALQYLNNAMYFKFNGQVHKYCPMVDRWTMEALMSNTETDSMSNIDDQATTDDDNVYSTVADDPMLSSNLHDQILDALNSVVTGNSPMYNGSNQILTSHNITTITPSASWQDDNFQRPSTPTNSKDAIPNGIDSSPLSNNIITGWDVNLAMKGSVDSSMSTNNHDTSYGTTADIVSDVINDNPTLDTFIFPQLNLGEELASED